MANERDKQLYQEIGRVYDSSVQVINELAAELVDLEKKFGNSSKIFLKKQDQLRAFRLLYDKSADYIDYLRELNDRMFREIITRELTRHKVETGLSFAQLAELLGWDPERWKKIDDIEQKFPFLQERADESRREESSFERFVDQIKSSK